MTFLNYVDGNTPFDTGLKISNVLCGRNTVTMVQKRYRMKLNPDQYYLLLNNNKEVSKKKIGSEAITNNHH